MKTSLEEGVSIVLYEARKTYSKYIFFALSRLILSIISWLSFFAILWMLVFDLAPVTLKTTALVLISLFLAISALPSNPDYPKKA